MPPVAPADKPPVAFAFDESESTVGERGVVDVLWLAVVGVLGGGGATTLVAVGLGEVEGVPLLVEVAARDVVVDVVGVGLVGVVVG